MGAEAENPRGGETRQQPTGLEQAFPQWCSGETLVLQHLDCSPVKS